MNILFLDTETTGLEDGRLVELAYKKRGEDNIVVEYFKPPVSIEIGAMAVHHITEKMVAGKPPFSGSDAQKKLTALLEDSVMVAHNAKFDAGILEVEGVHVSKYICTFKVAHHLYEEAENHKLQYLRYLWEIELDDAIAHDAKGDVLVLEKIFERMLSDYCKKHNCAEVEALAAFIDISSKPILLRKIHFGKHAGKTFKEVKAVEPTYLTWLYTLKDKGEDFLYSVQYYLEND